LKTKTDKKEEFTINSPLKNAQTNDSKVESETPKQVRAMKHHRD